jgi:hypothetical protein
VWNLISQSGEEQRMRTYEKKVMSRIFGSMKDELKNGENYLNKGFIL